MADNTKVEEQNSSPMAQPKLPLLPLIAAVMIAVVAGAAVVGVTGWYLVRSGRLPGVQAASVSAARPAAAAPTPARTKLVALEPLLANLAGEGGHSYLRLAMTLRVEDLEPTRDSKPREEKADKGKPANEFEAAMRDAALNVLGRETATDLLAEGGKERLKQQLGAALATRVPETKVKDILFTEFLVQR